MGLYIQSFISQEKELSKLLYSSYFHDVDDEKFNKIIAWSSAMEEVH